MTSRRCSRGTTMGYVDKDDDTNGGDVKRDKVTNVFGGAVEDEATARF